MKLNKIFTALAGVALLWGASACTDEVKYDPTPKYDGDQVFFSINDPEALQIPLGAQTFGFPLHRYSADGELTVGLECTITDPQGTEMTQVFSLPTQVTFPAGEKDIEVPVGVVFSAVTPEMNYTLSVKIAGEKTSPYGPTAAVFVASYAPWSEWEEYSKVPGTGVMGNIWPGEVVEGIVGVRSSLINDNLISYLFPGPRYNNLYFDYELSVDKSNTWIDENGTTCYRVSMPLTDTHFDTNDGDRIMYMDAFNWMRQYGAANGMNRPAEEIDEIMAKNGFGQSYYNPETGTFYLWLVPCVRGQELARYSQSYTVLQLPGFAHYDITFSALGSFVDPTGLETYIVEAVKSSDIDAYAYTLVAGALTEEQVQVVADKIKEDPNAELIYDDSYHMMFDLTEEGKYTVVAVGYDAAGNVVYETSYTFAFTSAQHEVPWETVGYVTFTDGLLNSALTNFPALSWDVEIQESLIYEGYYRLVNPYKDLAEAFAPQGMSYLRGNYYLCFDISMPQLCYIEMSSLGVNLGDDDPLWVMSESFYMLATGSKPADVIKAGVNGTYVDGVVTFPKESIMYTWESKMPSWYIGNKQGTFAIDMNPLFGNSANAPATGLDVEVPVAQKSEAKAVKESNIIRKNLRRAEITREDITNYFLSNPEKTMY